MPVLEQRKEARGVSGAWSQSWHGFVTEPGQEDISSLGILKSVNLNNVLLGMNLVRSCKKSHTWF